MNYPSNSYIYWRQSSTKKYRKMCTMTVILNNTIIGSIAYRYVYSKITTIPTNTIPIRAFELFV